MMSSSNRQTDLGQTLFNIARTAINCNPLIKEVYKNNLQKSKSGLSAIGVVMHKIIRIVYGMLKTNTAFNPDIDRGNTEHAALKKPKVVVLKSIRFQELDSLAPVSKKQNKKFNEYMNFKLTLIGKTC